MRQVNFWTRKQYRRAVHIVGGRLYVNPDPAIHRSILVAGTARSGTTWLGDLIAAQIPSRIMFEPFNPERVSEYREFNYFQYMRPGQEDRGFSDFAQKVFSGKIRNRWIDRQNERLFPQYRLIKEIRANLSLKWLHDNFPEVPIIFLIRHPCAVVLSRMELGWATDGDIAPFLSQPDLVADYLQENLDMIHSARTDEEKHAIIWSVSNLVPLKQLARGDRKIVYYEDLCTQPEVELRAVFASIGQPYKNAGDEKFNQPSVTTQATSAVVTGNDKTTSWKKKLNPTQIDNILRVVEAFQLDHLYGDSHLPLRCYDQ